MFGFIKRKITSVFCIHYYMPTYENYSFMGVLIIEIKCPKCRKKKNVELTSFRQGVVLLEDIKEYGEVLLANHD